jgi:hypothetical protein
MSELRHCSHANRDVIRIGQLDSLGRVIRATIYTHDIYTRRANQLALCLSDQPHVRAAGWPM